MKRSVLLCLTLSCLFLPDRAAADLAADLRPVLEDKYLRKAGVGVEIVRLSDRAADAATVFEYNAHAPRIPASNLKLVTTAAALDRFGPDFKFRTVLLMRGENLILVGDGDPTLGDAEYLRTVGWGTGTVFEAWAKQLKGRGVFRVRDVLIDDSVFDQEFVHPRWPDNQYHLRYVAQVGGLNLNANCLDFYITPLGPGRGVTYVTDPVTRYAQIRNSCRSGNESKIWLSRHAGGNTIDLKGEATGSNPAAVSVTIHDPPMFAGTVFAEALGRGGIEMTGSVRRDPALREQREQMAAAGGGGWTLVGIHETPLATVLARANKDSMNLYAESLCKRLGFEATKQSGSWANGTAAIGDYLRRIGVDNNEFRLDDGCGLSKENLISPHAINRVLIDNFTGKHREAFLASLSVAGVDGTLSDRFKGSDLRGRVFGKSGYVSGVRSLSGYVKAKDGRHYAFSILINRVSDAAEIKRLQERIVQAIDANASTLAAGE